MNRRALIRSAITVGLIASILNGRRLAQPEYKLVVYGTARTFANEADMYEAITGRRSVVL